MDFHGGRRREEEEREASNRERERVGGEVTHSCLPQSWRDSITDDLHSHKAGHHHNDRILQEQWPGSHGPPESPFCSPCPPLACSPHLLMSQRMPHFLAGYWLKHMDSDQNNKILLDSTVHI